MARKANLFTDPLSGFAWAWPINHSEEEAFGKTRNLEPTAPSAHGQLVGIGLILQQGAEGPMQLSLKGTILDPAQQQWMVNWFNLCRTQSIYFTDFAGDKYEVIITNYLPVRERVARNPKGGTKAPNHIWRYEMQMTVLRFIEGPWKNVMP